MPESAPHSLTALVKAVIERVGSPPTTQPKDPAPAATRERSPDPVSPAAVASGRITLQPQAGAMQALASVPGLDHQCFALGIPETIGCREAMLVNFPEAWIEWRGPDREGVVSDRTDGSWIVTLSEPSGTYMAATAIEAVFLFDNLDRCCIHAAPGCGDIGPGESSTTVSRLYLARGTLDSFLARFGADRPGLAARQQRARPPGLQASLSR